MFKIYRAAYSSVRWGRDEKSLRGEMLHLILLFASLAFTEKVSISPWTGQDEWEEIRQDREDSEEREWRSSWRTWWSRCHQAPLLGQDRLGPWGWLRFWPDPSLLAAQLRLLPHLLPRWSSGSIFQWWTPSGRGLPGRGAHGPGGHEGVCLLLHENEVAP